MFKLKSSKGDFYDLFSGSQHTVGKVNADIELNNDTSVSRNHASINVTIKDRKVRLVLRDCDSKYGTYVNEGINSQTRIAANTSIEIRNGDKVRFGLQWNTWIVEEVALCVCSDELNSQDKKKLESIISALHGSVVSKWLPDCTHLTTKNIAVNKKVACALASIKPIVTLEYWKKVSSAMNSRVEIPFIDCNKFFPPFLEPIKKINPKLFEKNLSRKHLFDDITLYTFSDKQYEHVFSLVSSSGGTVLNVSESGTTSLKHTTGKFIVLDPLEKGRNDHFKPFLDNIQSTQLRLIPENEIVFSIILCSVDIFCNPFCDPEDEEFYDNAADIILLKNNIQTDSEDDTILVDNTQPESQNSNIPLAFSSTKRIFEECSDDDEEEDNGRLFKIPTTKETRNSRKKVVDNDDDWNMKCANSSRISTRNDKSNINQVNDDGGNAKRNLRNKKNALFDFPVVVKPTSDSATRSPRKSSLASTSSSTSDHSIDLFDSGKRKRSEHIAIEEKEEEDDDKCVVGAAITRTSKRLRCNEKATDRLDYQMNKAKQSFMSNFESSKVPSVIPENNLQTRAKTPGLSNDDDIVLSNVSRRERKPEKSTLVDDESCSQKEPSQFMVTIADQSTISKPDYDQVEPEIREMMNKVKIVVKPLVVTIDDAPISLENQENMSDEIENVKRFKKQQYIGLDVETSLPIIIAGNDLFVHDKPPSANWGKMGDDDEENSAEELF